MSVASPKSVVITDTSIIINLSHTGHLALLGQMPALRFVVPDEVVAEIIQPTQVAVLEEALGNGFLHHEALASPEELRLFADLCQILGSGEAACLALAEARGWIVACDEKRVFLREARRRLGPDRLLNTPGIYVLLIRAGLLSVEEADAAKTVLEDRRYRMAFDSFRDVLPSDSPMRS